MGDGATPEVVEAMSTVKDPRVRFVNRPRPEYPPGLEGWHISGTWAINYGLDIAKGSYICVLADDDEQRPTFIEHMTDAIVEQRCDAAWCASEVVGHGYLGVEETLRWAGQAAGEFLWRRNTIRLDPECWRDGEPNDWNFVRRMLAAGIRFTHVREALYKYFPSSHIPPCRPTLPW